MTSASSRRNGPLRRILATGLVLGAMSSGAQAADLTIGSRVEMVPDPHYRWSAANLMFYRHYYGFLMNLDASDQAQPGLAESAQADGDTTWTFRLRPDAVFDNGKPVTATDVVSSLERARTLPNAAGSYAGLFSGVTEMSAPDPHTVRIVTSRPVPTLPNALTQVSVVPAEIAKTAGQADFASGKAAIGSAAYKFVSFAPGDRLVLERSPTFRGPKAQWDKVTFRFMPDTAARTAALLGGDVDLIDGVAPQDVPRIKADGRFVVHTGRSDRGLFLMPDTERDVTPFVKGPNGEPLSKNPFKDVRVRQALNFAIDRYAIRDRVMEGLSYPTGQLVPEGFGGYSKNIPVPAYDPAKARALLTEAGYPNGFSVTLHCTNDRYVNDARICQALGQMLTRVGVKTEVQTLASAAFFPKVTAHAGERTSLVMMSWSAASSGEADVLQNVIHTYDGATKLGTWNLGHYSNPEVDKLIENSLVTLDRTARHAIEARAMELAMLDAAVMPIHDQSVVVATRKELTFRTWADESTMADEVKPK